MRASKRVRVERIKVMHKLGTAFGVDVYVSEGVPPGGMMLVTPKQAATIIEESLEEAFQATLGKRPHTTTRRSSGRAERHTRVRKYLRRRR